MRAALDKRVLQRGTAAAVATTKIHQQICVRTMSHLDGPLHRAREGQARNAAVWRAEEPRGKASSTLRGRRKRVSLIAVRHLGVVLRDECCVRARG